MCEDPKEEAAATLSKDQLKKQKADQRAFDKRIKRGLAASV